MDSFISSFSIVAIGGILIASFLLLAISVVSMCLVFKKAGRKWWEALVPIYNMYVLTVIIRKPWWILFGFLIPIVSYGVGIYMYYHVSKRFGYDIPFTIGLVLLPFIFFPVLAFGDAVYVAPSDNTEAAAPNQSNEPQAAVTPLQTAGVTEAVTTSPNQTV